MKTRKKVGFTKKCIAVGALLSATGCGAPAEQQAPGESVETAAQQLVVGVDFTVAEVSAPTGITPGHPFPVRVKVCNQGTQFGVTGVEVFLSSNTRIETTDTSVGSLPSVALEPGACATQQVQAQTALAEGTYSIGAIADTSNQVAEANETNNARAGNKLGVGYKADFVVKSVSAPANVRPGEQSSVRVTVCNQGTVGESSESALVLSADTDIALPGSASGDELLAQFGGEFLQPGQCRTSEVAFIAPSVEGTSHLGVVADATGRVPEFFETNNTRASKPMGIGLKPDLVVKGVQTPANVLPWSGFGASATVCNQGTLGTQAEVEFYLSTDEVISTTQDSVTPDYSLGLMLLGWLEPGQCATKDMQLSSNVPGEGTWYFGAVANPFNRSQEFIGTNNTWGGEPMGIGNGPDFVIKNIKGPRSMRPGESSWAQVTACNQGTQPGDAEVELVLSDDAVISAPGSVPADRSLGRAFLGSMGPGQCVTQWVDANLAGVSEGTYHLGARVDPEGWIPELQEGNNTQVGEELGVGHKADFIVKSVSGPTIARPGAPFTTSVTVCNNGTVDDVARVTLVLSSDKELDATAVGSEQERFLADVDLGLVHAGFCATREVTINPGSLPGHSWYLGALVGSASGQQELIASNNTKVGALMGIGDAPDLVIKSVQAPASARPGERLETSVTVCNQGTQDAMADTMVVLSRSTEFSAYPEAGMGHIFGHLPAGQCITQKVGGTAPMAGEYHVVAMADPQGMTPELLETNNSRASARLGIGEGPDFVVKQVSVPPSVRRGEGFVADVTVCNQGTMADSADVALVLSQDADVSSFDGVGGTGFLASAFVDYLQPGQCGTVRMPATAQAVNQGAFYVGAIVDPYGSRMELLESNNARAAAMGIGELPDLVVKEVRGPSILRLGEPITVDLKVCNQGMAPAFSTDVMVFGTREREVTGESIWAGATRRLADFRVDWLEPGQCLLGATRLFTYPGVEGTWSLGAMVDPYNMAFELNEDNNVRIGEALGIGDGPDLTVKEVSGARLSEWGELLANVTVCNQGSQGADANVAMLLSPEKDPSLVLPLVPSAAIRAQLNLGFLEPGRCATHAFSAPVNASEGMYYLTFVADPFGQTPEVVESNNVRASSSPVFVYMMNTSVSEVRAPAVVRAGEPLAAEVSVCSTSPVGSAYMVELYLTPYEGAGMVQQLGAWYVAAMGPLPCTSVRLPISSLPEGLWRLRARVPGYDFEFYTDDNARDGDLLVVRQ